MAPFFLNLMVLVELKLHESVPVEGVVTVSMPKIGKGEPAADETVPTLVPVPSVVEPFKVKTVELVLVAVPSAPPAPPPVRVEPMSSNSLVPQSPPPAVPVVQSVPVLTAYTPLALVLI